MPEPAAPPPCACQGGRGSETAPETAVAHGAFTIERSHVHAAEHFTEWHLRCTACGRRYRVTDDQGYWKTLYQWEALDRR